MSAPQATVVITTKNRKADLAKAVQSAVDQQPEVAIIVIDDGSIDGTSQMIAEQFPQVQLHRFEQSRGYIVGRNYGAQLATTPYLFSIDDDAAFSTSDVVATTIAEFDHPRIAGVAIPYIDVNRSPNVIPNLPPLDDPEQWYVSYTYTGTAHALRRDRFIEAGGYRESLFHQGEERDLSLRLLDRGYVLRIGKSQPIHHFESPNRASKRMSIYGRRNDILFIWNNVPGIHLLPSLIGSTIKGLSYGIKTARPFLMAWGLLRGWCSMITNIDGRRPVSRKAYRLHRKLMRDGPFTFRNVQSEIEAIPTLDSDDNST